MMNDGNWWRCCHQSCWSRVPYYQILIHAAGNTEEDIQGFPLWSEANGNGPVQSDNSEFTNYFPSEGSESF